MRTSEELLAEAEANLAAKPLRSIAASLLVLARRSHPDPDLAAHGVCEAVEEFFTHPSDATHARLLSAWQDWNDHYVP